MNDEGVFREANYVAQALTTCRANCDELAAKYRGVMETDAEARDCDWLQDMVSFIDRQAVYAQLGVEEIQIYKMTHQLLVESDLRVRKYANELRAAEQRNNLLLTELRHAQEMLQKNGTLIVEQETKIADLTFLCDLKSLDDLHKVEPFNNTDADARLESILGNMSMASRGGPGLANDRTLFGDTHRLDEEDEEQEGEESIHKTSAYKNGEAVVFDEKVSPPPAPQPAKRVLTEAEQLRKKRNLAAKFFNSNCLDQSEKICKELLTQSYQRIAEVAGASVKDGEQKPPAECVWVMAERNQAENKSVGDQTDEERAALLASFDGKNEDIQAVLKVLSEIYRRRGQYIACELLEDVLLRTRSSNPAASRKHAPKSARSKSRVKKT